MVNVFAFRRRHDARASTTRTEASDSNVIWPRFFFRAKRTNSGQRFGGMPRTRQELTVGSDKLRLAETAAVPPKSSMIESGVSMTRTIVYDLKTCQEFASCDATAPAVCDEIGLMADPHAESTEAIARRLKATRDALGFQQQTDFAKALGIHKSTYNLFESGERRITITVAQRLRRKFGISLDWIYAGDAAQLPAHIITKLAPLAA